MIDDGTAEDSIGLTSGGSFVACNSFPVTGGNNVITSISIAWGTPAFPDPTLNGLPYTAVLWSDPNGDGSPTDAVVLAMAPGVISQQGTDTFITTVIPPTMVTTPNFFVGFVITHTAGQFPAAFDETAPTLPNRSWVAQTANINDLSGRFTNRIGWSGWQLAHSRRRQYRRANANGHAKPDTYRHLRGGLYDGYYHWHDNPWRHRYRQPLRRLQHGHRSTLPGKRIWRSDFSGVSGRTATYN